MSTTTSSITSVGQAFNVLGISGGISQEEEVYTAFRQKVKEAADGTGGYSGDMDTVTQAKDYLLKALAEAREQGRRDEARRQEQVEAKHQEKAAHQRQRRQQTQEQPPPRPEEEGGQPHQSEPERQEGEPPQLQRPQMTAEQHSEEEPAQSEPVQAASQREKDDDGGADPALQGALILLQNRRAELMQIRRREQELAQELKHVQAHRQALEQVVQSAGHLAEQLRAILAAGVAQRGQKNDQARREEN
jgi:hypothetical protein